MTLSDIEAECERDKARMDSSHERMDRLTSEGGSGKESTKQDVPEPVSPYAPQPRGLRPAVLFVAIFAILLLIFATVLVFLVLLDRSPTDVYKEYVDASNDRDIKRMFDQTVTQFTPDYEQRLGNLSNIVFIFDPEIEIVELGVTHQADLTETRKLLAQIVIDDLEAELAVQVDDYCYVYYTVTVLYEDLDQSATFDGEVLCVDIEGDWYLAVPGYY